MSILGTVSCRSIGDERRVDRDGRAQKPQETAEIATVDLPPGIALAIAAEFCRLWPALHYYY